VARLTVEAGTPDWWGRAVAAMDRASSDRAESPTLLQRFANTAALPSPAAWPGGIAFHVALGVPVMSDGTFWYPMTVGAHL
jgi:hypothetical protein